MGVLTFTVLFVLVSLFYGYRSVYKASECKRFDQSASLVSMALALVVSADFFALPLINAVMNRIPMSANGMELMLSFSFIASSLSLVTLAPQAIFHIAKNVDNSQDLKFERH